MSFGTGLPETAPFGWMNKRPIQPSDGRRALSMCDVCEQTKVDESVRESPRIHSRQINEQVQRRDGE